MRNIIPKIIILSVATAGVISLVTVSELRMSTTSVLLTVSSSVASLSAPSTIPLATSSDGISTKTALTAPSPTSQKNIDKSLSLVPPVQSATKTGCTLNLSFIQTSGNQQAAGTAGYRLVAKNLGNATCENASISVYYADNETFISASPAAIDGYFWNLGAMAPAQETDIAIEATRSSPVAGGTMTDEACLSADNGTDACANVGQSSVLATETAPTSTSATPVAQAITTTPPATVTALTPEPGKELGVWVWTSANGMSPGTMQQTVDEAAANNFNVIYLTVDDFLGGTPTDALTSFLTLAAQKNISVDAEAGSRGWGQNGSTSEADEAISFVANYNATHAVKFRGVQFDVEPYLFPSYANNESGVLTQYLTLIDRAAQDAANDHLPLTVVVPHFFDSVIQWAPQSTIDGITAYPYETILRMLNRSSGNRIIVMAYRNFADGDDGSIALSQTEVDEADATGVKVLVAQETGPVTPSYVTFNGTSRSELATQASAIESAYAPNSSFGGIAIDYLTPFLQLP